MKWSLHVIINHLINVFFFWCIDLSMCHSGSSENQKVATAAPDNAPANPAGLPLAPSPCLGPSSGQEVKWDAAPTLLERQRENLTARLRREFGLCLADDDDDKTGKLNLDRRNEEMGDKKCKGRRKE